jgi:AraC family transcriptional regulator
MVLLLATTALSPRDLVSPREWVRLLGGVDLAPVPHLPGEPVDVAMFRFADLPERVELPALDAHYISFTLRGALVIERDLGRDADRARFRPGMSLILPAERENTWRWDAATDELHLYVEPRWLAEMAGRAGRIAPEPVARFAFEDRLLRSLAQALLEERRAGGLGGTLFREALSETIALHFLRTYCAVPDADRVATRLAPAALRRVRDLVEEELARDLSLDDLAAAAGLSRAHFARAFRGTTGQTPYGYLRACRVERARALLHASDLTAAEIAARTGFSSPSHLGRVFRSLTGSTPGEYRRQRRIFPGATQ